MWFSCKNTEDVRILYGGQKVPNFKIGRTLSIRNVEMRKESSHPIVQQNYFPSQNFSIKSISTLQIFSFLFVLNQM